mmetsp:Transcript_11084/g.41400  ORF Transcript_11084/g.41400 Transcript_11084/m.41400 type:complete len:506 (-) Transcript_11084:183-1700(-)
MTLRQRRLPSRKAEVWKETRPAAKGPVSLPEALLEQVEDFLTAKELLVLAVASTAYASHYRSGAWQKLFQRRWGTEDAGGPLGAERARLGKSLRLQEFWTTIEAGLMAGPSVARDLVSDALDWRNARTWLEQLFLLIQPGARIFSNASKRSGWQLGQDAYTGLETDPAASDPVLWKRACIIRDRGDDLLKCTICGTLDLFSRGMRQSEAWATASSTWIAPCNCPCVAHRRCAERHFRQSQMQSKWDPFCSFAYILRVETLSWESALSGGQTQEHLRTCSTCGGAVRRGWRLPDNLMEMAVCAIRDGISWRRFRNVWIYSIAIFGLILVVEGQAATDTSPVATLRIPSFSLPALQPLGGAEAREAYTEVNLTWPVIGGATLGWWVAQQVLLLQVFFSVRFSRVVSRLWRGPLYGFYCRLYMYFIVANLVIGLTYTPVLPRLFGWGDQPVGLVWGLWQMVRLLNVVPYFTVSNIVLYIHWKTNYRVATVADANDRLSNAAHPLLLIH